MGVFDGKVFILVGGARGIGRATAATLAREGARLVIADNGCATDGTGHDTNVVEECARELRAEISSSADPRASTHAEVLPFALDARAHDTPRQLIEAAQKQFGRIDGGLFSAGFLRDRAMLRTSDDDFDAVMDVHVRAPFRFARELGKALVEQKEGGSILLVSSAAGFFGTAAQASLAAAAGAVAGFTKTLALELRRQHVRVNTLVPTARTRLTEELPLFQAIRKNSLSAEHVAQVAAHLLSEQGRDVHGELIGVAGGRVYSFRISETSGLYYDEGPMPLTELAGAFRDVTRS